jgi:hypothetical protein
MTKREQARRAETRGTGGELMIYDAEEGDKTRPKNLCAKTVKREDAYEVWQAGDWTWYVLKKWQVDDDKPYARWFCNVVTPMVGEQGETGDVYVSEIKKNARRIR